MSSRKTHKSGRGKVKNALYPARTKYHQRQSVKLAPQHGTNRAARRATSWTARLIEAEMEAREQATKRVALNNQIPTPTKKVTRRRKTAVVAQ